MCNNDDVGRRPPVRLALALALAALVLGAPARPAAADPYQWGPPAGPFGDPASWLPPGPPGPADAALFLPSAPLCQVLFDASYTNEQLVVETSVSFQLGGFVYALTRDWDDLTLTGSAVVAQTVDSDGALVLLDGAVDAKELDIAHGSGTTGTVVVGEGARWTAFGHHIVTGRSGIGALTIQGGGIVEHGHGWAGMHGGSQGTVTVAGLGSEYHVTGWYGLGAGGQGYLSVADEGQAHMGKCDMAMNTDSYGEAVIDGADTLWELLDAAQVSLIIGQGGTAAVRATNEGTIVNAGSLHLGEGATGDGELTVEGSGRVAVGGQLLVGVAGYGSVYVAGTGSQLTVSGDGEGDGVGLKIGDGGFGALHVLDGGYVNVTNAALVGTYGGVLGNPSLLVVNGTDALFEGPTFLQVGAEAYGKAIVTEGGTLRAGAVNSVCSIGVFAPGEVAATAGGTFDYGWQVFVGDQNVGTLDVTDGGHYSAHSTLVGCGVGSDGTLTVRGPDSTVTHLSFLAVGWRGLGTAYFEDRCTVDLGGSLIVGGSSGGPGGTAYIRDGGYVISGTQARIGDYCRGELYITGGGVLESHKGASGTGSSGIIGRDTGVDGFVSVSGSESEWTQDGALTVGWLGQGFMEVLDDARVSCVDGLVGRLAGSDGYVLVSGTGSLWTLSGSAALGGSLTDPGGHGNLEIGADGGVEVGGTLRLWPTGTLVVDGGTVTAGGLAGDAGAMVHLQDPAGGTALTVGSPGTAAFFGDLRDNLGGSGSLRKVGTGTQTLAGAGITHTGLTKVLEGTLILSDTTAFASDILNSATTEFEVTAGTWTIGEALAGAGTFRKVGDGTLVICGPQDYDAGAIFEVLCGTVDLNTDASGTGLMADADLSILVTGAVLNLGCDQHLDTLTIGDGGLVRLTGANLVVLKHLVMDGVDVGAMTLTPEPATLSLLALGAVGVLLRRRK